MIETVKYRRDRRDLCKKMKSDILKMFEKYFKSIFLFSENIRSQNVIIKVKSQDSGLYIENVPNMANCGLRKNIMMQLTTRI